MKKEKIFVLGILGVLLLMLVGCGASTVLTDNNTPTDTLTYLTTPGALTSVVRKDTAQVISSQTTPSDGKISISVPKDCETIIIVTNADGSEYKSYVGAGQTYVESPDALSTIMVDIKAELESKGNDTSYSEMVKWISILGLINWDGVKDFMVEFLSKPETTEVRKTVETVMTDNDKDYSEYKRTNEENYNKEISEKVAEKIEQISPGETTVTLSDSERTAAAMKAKSIAMEEVVVKTGDVSTTPEKYNSIAKVAYTEKVADAVIVNNLYKEYKAEGYSLTTPEREIAEAKVAGNQDFQILDVGVAVGNQIVRESFDVSSPTTQLLLTSLDVVQEAVREQAEVIAKAESVTEVDGIIIPVQEEIVSRMVEPINTIAVVSSSDVVVRTAEITKIIEPDISNPIDTSLEITKSATELKDALTDVAAYQNVGTVLQRDVLNTSVLTSVSLPELRMLSSF